MITKCAWCNVILGEKEPFNDPTISHGICQVCFDKHLAIGIESNNEDEQSKE